MGLEKTSRKPFIIYAILAVAFVETFLALAFLALSVLSLTAYFGLPAIYGFWAANRIYHNRWKHPRGLW
jgi:hypothetical protein